jgi:hypothetical protein
VVAGPLAGNQALVALEVDERLTLGVEGEQFRPVGLGGRQRDRLAGVLPRDMSWNSSWCWAWRELAST